MGAWKPGFLRKYFKRARRFGKKRGFQESERLIQLTGDRRPPPIPGRKRIGVMKTRVRRTHPTTHFKPRKVKINRSF